MEVAVTNCCPRAIRILLFLLLLVASLPASAQQAHGPWRVIYQRVRARPEADDSWGNSRDTVTTWQTRRTLQKATWNVPPNSIRLFLNCDNPLRAPAASRGIRFTATGATLRLDAKQGLLWVFATQPTVVLRAFRGKVPVFQHEFQAVAPPLPRIRCLLPHSCLSLVHDCKSMKDEPFCPLVLNAVANNIFADFMPDDARYRVAKYQVTLLREGVALAPPVTLNVGTTDLARSEPMLRPGDKIQVDVLTVQRQNSRGGVESVPLEKQFILSIPDRK